jgi:hypothetical protein
MGSGPVSVWLDVLKRRVTVCLQKAVTQTRQWVKDEMEKP